MAGSTAFRFLFRGVSVSLCRCAIQSVRSILRSCDPKCQGLRATPFLTPQGTRHVYVPPDYKQH